MPSKHLVKIYVLVLSFFLVASALSECSAAGSSWRPVKSLAQVVHLAGMDITKNQV